MKNRDIITCTSSTQKDQGKENPCDYKSMQQKNLLIQGTNLNEKPLLQTLNKIGKIIRELGIG